MTIEISILIAITGCFIGLAGYLKSRDGKIATDSEWRGEVNAQLKTIIGIGDSTSRDVDKINDRLNQLDTKIASLESSYKSLHNRIDKMESNNRI